MAVREKGGEVTRGGPRPGAGRPPIGDGKRANLNIRTNESRIAAYREAAARAGVTLTAWVEMALDRAAVGNHMEEER